MKNNFNTLALEFKYKQTDTNFKNLYVAIQRPLLKFINNIVKDRDVANDVFQDVAMKIYQKIDMYNENFNFSTWSYTIARNECFGFLKSKEQKNRVSLSNSDENGIELTSNLEVTVLETVTNEAESFDFEENVTDAAYKYNETVEILKGLDPKYKEFLEDKYIRNMKEKEIATKHGCSKSMVKNRLFHGRKKIQKMYSERNVSV